MPKTDDNGNPIDQSVVALARAMRAHESKNDYTAKGGSGEYGAYQWMPGNYEAAAKKYGIDPRDKSPIAQDKVAYYSLLEDKKKGLSPEQIAAKWNSGSPTGWEKKKGVNKAGVKYDVPAYVAAVMANYQKEKALAQGPGLDPKKAGVGLALAPIAEAGELDNFQQPQQDAPEFDDTERMLMQAAGIQPGQEQGFEKPYTLNDIFNDFSVGVAKGELTTAKNLAKVVKPSMVLNMFSPALGAVMSSVGSKFDKIPGLHDLFDDEQLKPKGTAEKVGFGTERVAEFMAPAGLIRNGQLAIKAMLSGPGFLRSAGRVAGQAAVEAGGGGAVALAQTGDFKEAAKTGALFGGIKGVTGTGGEIARALKLPERIYSSIFKNTYKDVITELKTAGAAAFQKSHPEEFKALVEMGVIKGAKDGVIQINETIAKQALDRGLKGSLKNMANQTVAGLYRAEAGAKKAAAQAKAAGATVNMTEKQFANVLKEIEATYKDVGFGEFAKKAKTLGNAVKMSKGKVDPETALAIRRLLDGARRAQSFGQPMQKLSLSQQNLKFLADTLRSRVNKVPGMGKAMEDYSFHIEALDHIGKEAARAGNRQIISLLDAVFFGGGAVSAMPAVGAGLGVARRILTVPTSATRIAQGIQNSGGLSKTGAVIKGLITSLRPFQEDQ